MAKNGFWPKKNFVQLIYLISRDILVWNFLNFLSHSALTTSEIASDNNRSSSDDDISDITCPFCSCNEEALLQGGGPYEGQPLYCTKGSICSRRSRATVLSRNVRGRRKKPSRPAAGTTKKATSSTKKAIAVTLHKANAAAGIVTKEARRHHLTGSRAEAVHSPSSEAV